MNSRSDLLQRLNRLRIDERALKNEELEIRRVKAAKDQREPLARNHEKLMKNKSQQGAIATEMRKLDTPTAPVAGPTVVPPTASQPPAISPSPPAPPSSPQHGDPTGP
jgi:hypothetical protein